MDKKRKKWNNFDVSIKGRKGIINMGEQKKGEQKMGKELGKQQTIKKVQVVLQGVVVLVVIVMFIFMIIGIVEGTEKRKQALKLEEEENSSIIEYYEGNLVVDIEEKQGLEWDKKVTLATGDVGYVVLDCEEELGVNECDVTELMLVGTKEGHVNE